MPEPGIIWGFRRTSKAGGYRIRANKQKNFLVKVYKKKTILTKSGVVEDVRCNLLNKNKIEDFLNGQSTKK